MVKKYLFLGFLAGTNLFAVQEIYISGLTIACKTLHNVRTKGDFEIGSPLQFKYMTQQSGSCLISFTQSESAQGSAKIVLLTPAERGSGKTPADYGYAGNFQFMYVTPYPNAKTMQNYYRAFVDYGDNPEIKKILEALKVPRHAVTKEEEAKLQTKAPASDKDMTSLGAKF